MILRKDLDIEDISEKIIQDGNKKLRLQGKKYYYKDKLKNRYILEINILKNDKKNTLTVIMFNPSEYEKKGLFVDQTITNVVKIANDTGYNFIKVLNLVTIIDSNQNNIKNNEKIDVDFILNEIDESDMLVAWGVKGNNYIKNNKNQNLHKIIERLKLKKNVYTFCANTNRKYPKHPARLDVNCCRNCYGRSGTFTLEKLNF